MHLCDNISLHRRGPQHHSIKTPVFGKFEIRLCSPKASVPSPSTTSSSDSFLLGGPETFQKTEQLVSGDRPPFYAYIHMQKRTHTCTYRHMHTYTHTHILHHPLPLIPTVASSGFWPRLCGVVGKRAGDPGQLGDQLQEGPWCAHLNPGRVRALQRGVLVYMQRPEEA